MSRRLRMGPRPGEIIDWLHNDNSVIIALVANVGKHGGPWRLQWTLIGLVRALKRQSDSTCLFCVRESSESGGSSTDWMGRLTNRRADTLVTPSPRSTWYVISSG